MKDRPVVFLGVNSDRELAHAREGVARYQLPWRSWWEGIANGPVSLPWKVQGLPFAIVIDADGVVRYRGSTGAALEARIEELLAAKAK